MHTITLVILLRQNRVYYFGLLVKDAQEMNYYYVYGQKRNYMYDVEY